MSETMRVANGSTQVSPVMAKEILISHRFPGQRKEYPHQVHMLANMMSTGEWLPNDQISFCRLPSGTMYLVNGYHRLLAVQKYGLSVVFDFRILPAADMDEVRAIYNKFDTAIRKRSDGEVIKAAGILDKYGISSAVAKSVYRAAVLIANDFKGLNYQNAPNDMRNIVHKIHAASEYWETAKIYESYIKLAQETHRKRMLIVGITSVAIATIRHQPAKAKEFWTKVATMDELKIDDARLTLAKMIDSTNFSGSSIPKDDETPPPCIITSLAWNAFFYGKPLKTIRQNAQFRLAGTKWK